MKFVRGYPEYMRKLIDKVNQTRVQRKDYTPTAMSKEEREEVLNLHHPDFVTGGKRKIALGQNKGDIAPNEVVDLLEAYPLIDGKEIDIKNIDHDVDILIIGGGLAGTSAAILANDNGIPTDKILLTNKLRHGDANSIMAEGGTQAADRENDSPSIHFIDAMGGGHYTNKPDVLKSLVEDGPKVMEWLLKLGAMIDRQEDGNFVENWGGGTSRKRMHACRDYVGLEELRVIRDEFRNRKIPVLEFYPAIELLTDGTGRVSGAVLWNFETKEYKIVRSKAVVMATGGFGRLHIRGFPTTNHYGATADGVVLSYRVGAKLRDADTVQYHPTGAVFPQQIIGHLLTEKLRSMGAQPVNIDGEAFVFPLEPRDVEASSFIRECYVNSKGVETPTGMLGVWLDTPLIELLHGPGTIDKEFPGMVRMYEKFEIDIKKDPVLVFPSLHYQNGGVETDPDGFTNVEGLFVAGEVTGGVHGKNRLMGNSTLDCMVFGRRSGTVAAKYVKKAKRDGKITLKHLDKYVGLLKKAKIKPTRKAPILLPEYRGKAALGRMIDVF